MAVYKYIYWREDMPHQVKQVTTIRNVVVTSTSSNWNQPATKKIELADLQVIAEPPVSKVYANVHILRGYTSNSIKDFEDLLEIIRAEVTKKANKHNVECCKVTKSNYCQGFTLLAWSGYLTKQVFDGWYAAKQCDYYY